MVLDEYVEFLNCDSKIVCLGFQIKESILEFLMVVNVVKYYDLILLCDIMERFLLFIVILRRCKESCC